MAVNKNNHKSLQNGDKIPRQQPIDCSLFLSICSNKIKESLGTKILSLSGLNMDLIQIRRTLHQHPEVGFEEYWTSEFLADQLEKLGLEVYRNIAKTGLVAVLPGKNRSHAIGYRADIDALPIAEKLDVPWKSTNGCMHACGHDAHMTIALGTAEKLTNLDEKLDCNVVFVFQPNEEGAPGELPSGAELMCSEGILERFHIEKMMALHCDPTLESGKMGVCRGTLWAASGRFVVRIVGKSAHAAYPEQGHDALWAASDMVSAIYAALNRLHSASVQEVASICKLNAGNAFNVIAGNAQFEGIMRAPSRKHLDEIKNIIQNTVKYVAEYANVHAECDFFYGANAVINDDDMTQIALDTWGGAKNIQMTMASEDFSHFSERIPCFYAMLGICPSGETLPPLHSDVFTLDESTLAEAADRMMQLILQLSKLF